jgi:hypothetical protein
LEKATTKVIEHIKVQGFTVIDHEPTPADRMQYARLAKVIRTSLPIMPNGLDGYFYR